MLGNAMLKNKPTDLELLVYASIHHFPEKLGHMGLTVRDVHESIASMDAAKKGMTVPTEQQARSEFFPPRGSGPFGLG